MQNNTDCKTIQNPSSDTSNVKRFERNVCDNNYDIDNFRANNVIKLFYGYWLSATLQHDVLGRPWLRAGVDVIS